MKNKPHFVTKSGAVSTPALFTQQTSMSSSPCPGVLNFSATGKPGGFLVMARKCSPMRSLSMGPVFPKGGLSEKLRGGVRLPLQNPYPTNDQNLRYSLPYL